MQKEKKSIRRAISLPLNLTGSDVLGMKTSAVLHRSSEFLEQLKRQTDKYGGVSSNGDGWTS